MCFFFHEKGNEPILKSCSVLQALVECQGDSIDLSGDMGAVGRVIISDSPSGDQEMCLDLKGILVHVL
jgi:hypothetical protein